MPRHPSLPLPIDDLHHFCGFTGKLDIPRHILVLLKPGKYTSTVVCGSVLLNKRARGLSKQS